MRCNVFVSVLALVLLGGAGAASVRAELSAADWTKAAERAEAAARRGDDREAGDALIEVGKDDSERAAKLIAAIFAKFPGENETMIDRTYAAIDKLRSAKAVAQLRKELAAGKDWRLRVIIVDAFGARGRSEQEAIAKALEDKQEEAVRAAVRQLARMRTEQAILALCGAMEKLDQKGKTAATWQDMRNALTRALGVELQGGADYRNYFDANKARFVEGRGIPPDPAKGGGARGAGEGGGGGRVGETVVFGTELYCKNVIIIFDKSGSMDVADPYPPGFDPGSVPRGYIESNGITDPDRNRMVRARKELLRLLDGLAKAKGKVNMVAYSTNVDCWRDQNLHEVSGDNLRSAKKWVEELKPEGVTCTDVAIEIAFQIAPQADCFYLISDGKPTHDGQTHIPAAKILGEVERLNKLRKVQFNTFGFIPPKGGEGADVELMKGLAEQTGGTYTEIR